MDENKFKGTLSYAGLRAILGARKIGIVELSKAIKASSATLAKIKQDEPLTITTLLRICDFLDCKLSEIVEYTPAGEMIL